MSDESKADEIVLSVRKPNKAVTLVGEDGKKAKYTIREMSGEDQAWWLRQVGRRFQVNRDGRPVKQNYDGMHDDLIGLCLYAEDGKKVPKSTIERFGVAAKNKLFALCQTHNCMTAAAEEEELGN